jgi:hypothetical protein
MVFTTTEDKDGGVVLASVLSAGRIRNANELENRYGLDVG